MILSTSSREGSPDELVISSLGYPESPESPGLMPGAVKIASPEKSHFSNSRSDQPCSRFSRLKTICQKCGEHYRPRWDLFSLDNLSCFSLAKCHKTYADYRKEFFV